MHNRKGGPSQDPAASDEKQRGRSAQSQPDMASQQLLSSANQAKAANFVCLGDIISLLSDDTDGFVGSLSSCSTYNGVRVEHNQGKALTGIPDVQGCRFEICIQNRYKLNKKLRKHYAKYENEQADLEIRAQYEAAKNGALAENADNIAEQTRNTGRKLRYGDTIQLKHVFTNKFIHVDTQKTSQIDKNNMILCLHEYNAKNAQFRILPRYKVKSEGEYVESNDQVTFESIKSPGHFYHVSKIMQIDAMSHASELNLGVEQSGFTIIKASTAHRTDDMTYIWGGEFVQLYHKDLEAYLVAEGVFDGSISENAHFRIRAVDQLNPRTLRPSTSAITYWQIESEKSILDGESLTWHQQLRFRNVCTRQYLSVDENLEAGLTANGRDPRTVFKLHPVMQEGELVSYGSYARIEHVLTSSWLHAVKDREYVRQEYQAADLIDARSMQALKWDGGDLRYVDSCGDKKYDDAYTIQAVEISHARACNRAAGFVPILLNFISERERGAHLNTKSAQRFLSALKEMEDFMFVDKQVDKNRQKLFRSFKIVDLLVKVLKFPISGVIDEAYLTKVFVSIYAILYTYMYGSSKKNALYFAKYIDFFETLLSQKTHDERALELSLNIARMLAELIRDNRKIVDRIKSSQIDRFIDFLKASEDYRFLDLLRVLCLCQNVAIPDNQSQIATNWLQRDRRGVYLFERGQNINKSPNVVYISTDRSRTWVQLSDFVDKTTTHYTEEKYTFLLHQLDLFAALCYGRNSYCIRLITHDVGCLEWEVAFLCIKTNMLPDSIRAKFCSIIVDLFVDVGKNYSIIDTPQLAFVYEYIGTKEVQQLTTPEQYAAKDLVTLFPVIRDWIAEFMLEHHNMIAADVGHNQLITEVLRLLRYLIKFGYYEDFNEVDKLLPALLSLVDGRKDLPVHEYDMPKDSKRLIQDYRLRSRFEQSNQTKWIVEAKCAILDVLELYLQFETNSCLEKFVEKFKECETSTKTKRPNALSRILDDSFDLNSTSSSGQRMLQEIKRVTSQAIKLNIQQLTDILLDLTNYRYDKIIQLSLKILSQLYSIKSTIFQRANQALILMTQDSTLLHRSVSRMVPLLRLMARLKWNEEHLKVIVEIIDELIRACHLTNCPNENQPMNQRILLSHGTINVIFHIVAQDIGVLEATSTSEIIFSKALKLLQALLLNMPEVQATVFERLEELLNINIGSKQLALTMKNVFYNNENLCLKVAPKYIMKLVNLCAQHQERTPEFLDVLCALVRVEGSGLCIKRNQTLVMKYIMQNYTKVASILNESRQNREALLLQQNEPDKVQYLTSLIELLATCAEGENRYIESLCQTIVTMDELLWILHCPEVEPIIKRPFVKYLTNAYMKTSCDSDTKREGGKKKSNKAAPIAGVIEDKDSYEDSNAVVDSSASEMIHHDGMWNYLQTIIAHLRKLSEEMSYTDPQTLFFLANNLYPKRVVEHEDCPVCYYRPKEYEENYYALKQIVQLKERESFIHKGIYYMLDSVFTCIQTFFAKFYSHDPSFANEQLVVDQLTEEALHFCEILTPYLMRAEQLRVIVGCLMYLVPKSRHPSSVLEKIVARIGKCPQIDDPAATLKQSNELYYALEEKINNQLRKFATKCARLSNGPNNVSAQIKCGSSKRMYTEIGSQDELPLGEEFQSFVQCFVNPSAKQPEDRYKCVAKLIDQLAISIRISTESKEHRGLRNKPQEELDIRCLQILRALLHNEERKLPEDWHQHACETKIKKSLDRITELQNIMNKFGAFTHILPHLASSNDHVVREVLALQTLLLFNANRSVQRSLLSYFMNTREEVFFFAVKNRFALSSASIKERRLLVEQQRAKQLESREHAERLTMHLTMCKRALKQIKHMELEAKLEDALKNRSDKEKKKKKKQKTNKDKDKDKKGDAVIEVHEGSDNERETRGLLPSDGRNSAMALAKSESVGTSRERIAPSGQEYTNARMTASESTPKTLGNAKTSKKDEQEFDEADEDRLASHLGLKDDTVQKDSDNSKTIRMTDDGCVELVLKLCARMCDGQYRDLQDYLRAQPDNVKSFNLVAEISNYLGVLYSNINKDTIGLVTQMLKSISEVLVGNQANREVTMSCKTIDYINFILRTARFEECELHDILSLLTAIASLLIVMIEENGPECLEIAREVKDTIDKEAILRIITECYEVGFLAKSRKFQTKKNQEHSLTAGGNCVPFWSVFSIAQKRQHRDLFVDLGYSFFRILLRLIDIDPDIERRFCAKPQILSTAEKQLQSSVVGFTELNRVKALKYFREHMLSIEIVKDDHLQKVNFRVKNKHVLREDVKEVVKWELDRSSPTNKIRSFMDWSRSVLADIKYQRKVMIKPLMMVTTSIFSFWNSVVVVLSVILNVLFMWSFRPEDKEHSADMNRTALAGIVSGIENLPIKISDLNETAMEEFDHIIFKAMYFSAYLHNGASFMVTITYFLANQLTLPHFNALKKWRRNMCKRQHDEAIELPSKNDKNKASCNRLAAHLFSFTTIYYLAFFAMSLGGTFVCSFLFAFHLLNIVNNNQLLQRVIKAVTQNGRSLLWVAILGVVIMYIFSIIGFVFYRYAFQSSSSYMFCGTLYECFMTVSWSGLIGKLWDGMIPSGNMVKSFWFMAFVAIYQLAFFILIATIGLNVIFGIIVDTFSELRDLKWQAELDMRENCFICSRTNHEFEHYGKGFANHVKTEHNMWAYIFYMVHLNDTKPEDYTALDMYVARLLADAQFEFFPQNRALCLTGSDEYSYDSKVDELLKKVDVLLLSQAKEEVEKQKQIELERQRLWQEKHRMNIQRKQIERAPSCEFEDHTHAKEVEAERVKPLPHHLRNRKQSNDVDKFDARSEKSDASKLEFNSCVESGVPRKPRSTSPTFNDLPTPSITPFPELKLESSPLPPYSTLDKVTHKSHSKAPSQAASVVREPELEPLDQHDAPDTLPKYDTQVDDAQMADIDDSIAQRYPSQDPLQFLESLSISSDDDGEEHSAHRKDTADEDEIDLVKL